MEKEDVVVNVEYFGMKEGFVLCNKFDLKDVFVRLVFLDFYLFLINGKWEKYWYINRKCFFCV